MAESQGGHCLDPYISPVGCWIQRKGVVNSEVPVLHQAMLHQTPRLGFGKIEVVRIFWWGGRLGEDVLIVGPPRPARQNGDLLRRVCCRPISGTSGWWRETRLLTRRRSWKQLRLTAMVMSMAGPRAVHLQATAVAANWARLVALHPA